MIVTHTTKILTLVQPKIVWRNTGENSPIPAVNAKIVNEINRALNARRRAEAREAKEESRLNKIAKKNDPGKSCRKPFPPRNAFNHPMRLGRVNRWYEHPFCGYCGRALLLKEYTLDHIYPKSKGGRLGYFNSIGACCGCNQNKADKVIEFRYVVRVQGGNFFIVGIERIKKGKA